MLTIHELVSVVGKIELEKESLKSNIKSKIRLIRDKT